MQIDLDEQLEYYRKMKTVLHNVPLATKIAIASCIICEALRENTVELQKIIILGITTDMNEALNPNQRNEHLNG